MDIKPDRFTAEKVRSVPPSLLIACPTTGMTFSQSCTTWRRRLETPRPATTRFLQNSRSSSSTSCLPINPHWRPALSSVRDGYHPAAGIYSEISPSTDSSRLWRSILPLGHRALHQKVIFRRKHLGSSLNNTYPHLLTHSPMRLPVHITTTHFVACEGSLYARRFCGGV